MPFCSWLAITENIWFSEIFWQENFQKYYFLFRCDISSNKKILTVIHKDTTMVMRCTIWYRFHNLKNLNHGEIGQRGIKSFYFNKVYRPENSRKLSLSFTVIFYRRKSSQSPVKLMVIWCLRSIQSLK